MKSTLNLAVVGAVIITTILAVGVTAAVKPATQSASAMTIMPGNRTSGKMMKGNESSGMMKGNMTTLHMLPK
jgi:hypothetical protein